MGVARPRNFDDRQALESAARLFWRRGYAGTSVDDLVRVTKASRNGLYAAFGDKESLYLAGLDWYRDHAVQRVYQPLFNDDVDLTQISSFLWKNAAQSGTADGTAGCFMCNASAETADGLNGVPLRVHLHFERISRRFEMGLTNARQAGMSNDRQPLITQARVLTGVTPGLFMRARGGAGSHASDLAEMAISAVAA